MNSNNLILTFLAFLAMGFGKAGAQEVSTLSGWAPPQGAVVRQYIDNQSIYYFDDGTNHYFVLFDKANPSSAIVSQFPTDLELHDFEVYNKVVYFCGKQPNAGNPLGMVGQISVNDLFYTNQPYNIGLINHVQSSPPPTFEHLTSCDRMDVFEDAGQVHLAIVAEMEHGQGYGYTQRRTACDIWFNSTYSWQGSLLYQKNDLYKTSDITCTDDYVVVSAYDDQPQSILLVFKKIQDFPMYPLFPHSVLVKDLRYGNNILVERLDGNDIAVSHYYESPALTDYGTALHYIEDVGTLPSPTSNFSLHLFHGNTPPCCVQRDLRYNSTSQGLLLLHDIDDPLWSMPTSTVFDFQAYNLTSLSCLAWTCINTTTLMSVDNRKESPFFSLGGLHISQNEPLLTIVNSTPVKCHTSQSLSYDDITRYVSFLWGPFDETAFLCSGILYPIFYPNPSNGNITTLCPSNKNITK